MIESLYSSIADRIADKVPDILWRDIWNQQPLFEREELPIAYPALFVEVVSISWSTVSPGIQNGIATIAIHLVIESYGDTHQGSSNHAATLTARLALNTAMHQALQGYEDDTFTPLDRITTVMQTPHDNLIDFVHTYTTTCRDTSADPTRDYEALHPWTLKVTGQIEEEGLAEVDGKPAGEASPYIITQ